MEVGRPYLSSGDVELQRAAEHHDRGSHRAALTGYRRAVVLLPDRLEAVGSIGLIFQELGASEASLWLKRALGIDPQSEAALHNLALACREPDAATATRALRRLLALSPRHADAQRLLAIAMEGADVTAALCLLHRAHAIDPTSPIVLIALSGIHERLGDEAASAGALRSAVCWAPALVAVLNAAGMSAALSHQDERAILYYLRGLAREPRHPALLENLARAALRLGRSSDASRALRRAIVLTAGNAGSLLMLAIAEISLGREASARAPARHALAFCASALLSTEAAQARVILNVLDYLDDAPDAGGALEMLKTRFADWGWRGIDRLPLSRVLTALEIWERHPIRREPDIAAGGIAAEPQDAVALAERALDQMRLGAAPSAVAPSLVRAWAMGRAGGLDARSLINLKRASFGVAVRDPEAAPPLRAILREPAPYPEDPAVARYDGDLAWRYRSESSRSKVIYVENKYEFGFAGQRGEASTGHVSMRRSVASAEAISGMCLYFDEHFLSTGRRLWPDLIAFVETNGCDLIVLHVISNSPTLTPLLPSRDEVSALRRLGCRILLLGSDLVYPGYREAIRRQLGHIGDAYLAIDIPPFLVEELDLQQRFDKPLIGGWPPQELPLFDEVTAERDVEVGFCGNLLGYPDRLPAIRYLRSKGMAVETNRPGQVVTHDQYVHLLKRSSMVLNFASTFPGRIDPIFSEDAQIKARVLEGMSAGCVVLEKDNLYSRRNFAHMQDIVFYRDLDDALAKIDQLREDPDLLRRIGRNAHATIAARFDSNCFWKHVLTSAGLTGLPTRSPT